VVQPAVTVEAHDDQVAAGLLGDLDDAPCGPAAHEARLDADVGRQRVDGFAQDPGEGTVGIQATGTAPAGLTVCRGAVGIAVRTTSLACWSRASVAA